MFFYVNIIEKLVRCFSNPVQFDYTKMIILEIHISIFSFLCPFNVCVRVGKHIAVIRVYTHIFMHIYVCVYTFYIYITAKLVLPCHLHARFLTIPLPHPWLESGLTGY